MRGRGEALDARAGRDGRARIGALTGKRGLSPAYFAFVMATGIVAIDARDIGMPTTATALFGLNVVAFALVACVALLHAVCAPRAAWRDVTNRHSGPPHLASVAAAAVLGSDFLLLADRRGAAALLAWAAVAAWLVLTYAVFAGITVSERKPPLADGISGTWLLAALAPFLKGLAVVCWATATWWIPLLLVLFVWRHAARRMPLRYDAAAWSAVFPLGMYAACTGELSDALHLRFLGIVVTGATYVALAAWALVFAGLVRSLLRRARSRIAPATSRAQ